MHNKQAEPVVINCECRENPWMMAFTEGSDFDIFQWIFAKKSQSGSGQDNLLIGVIFGVLLQLHRSIFD